MIRVLYICYEDLSRYNGATRHVSEVIRGLIKKGVILTLSAPILDGRGRIRAPTGARSSYIRTINKRLLRPLSYLARSFFRLPADIIRFKPDILYIRSIKFSIFPVLFGKLFRIPAVVEINGLFQETRRFRRIKSVVGNAVEWMHAWNIRHCSRIVTVTDRIRDEVVGTYGKCESRVHIVKNGVNLEVFRPIKALATDRRQLYTPPDRFTVGFLGGFFPWHGLDLLVRSAPLVVREAPQVRFMLVGDGLERPAIERMIEEQGLSEFFITTGMVTFDEVPDLINMFDVGISLFKNVRDDEGDPIKIYEYFACGVPVIATGIGGYKQIVDESNGGVCVSNRPEDISRTILNLFKDRDALARLGENALSYAVSNCGWDKRVSQIHQILRQETGKR